MESLKSDFSTMSNDARNLSTSNLAPRCLIVAEIGVNHNGSLSSALELIDAAVEAGADAVKFQTFKAESVISRFAPKAEYQKSTTSSNESQLDMVRKLELTFDDHRSLVQHCVNRGIQYLSTPFDIDSARFLISELQISQVKIPSGEITNAILLHEVARLGRPVILSTGMSTLSEVENALGVLAFGYLGLAQRPSVEAFKEAYASDAGLAVLVDKVSLLHCTTEYPAPFEDINLCAMGTLRSAFGLQVGLSDHSEGIAIAIAARALGAVIIEKHFTLDRTLPGPDHHASIEPPQFEAMVTGIRQVEMALGDGRKRPTFSELKNIPIARKSLVAARPIRSGDMFSESNVAAKRPGDGVSPYKYWAMLGRTANRDYEEDEALDGE